MQSRMGGVCVGALTGVTGDVPLLVLTCRKEYCGGLRPFIKLDMKGFIPK